MTTMTTNSDLDRARARVQLLRNYVTEVIAGEGWHPEFRAGVTASGSLELAALAEAGLALREAIQIARSAPGLGGWGLAGPAAAYDAALRAGLGPEP